jgi:hypothetical protein
MQLPSAHQHQFSSQPTVQVQRSAFDRKHSNSFTFYSGYLVPFFHEALALPGDTINLKATIFARMNTPYFPIMTNVYLMVHFWAVPMRLLWDHWVNFMGEQTNPSDSTVYMTPISTIPVGGYAVHSLQDYFGLPVVETIKGTAAGAVHNVFLTRAYNKIWNKGYRDENLQNPVTEDQGDGPDTTTNYVLLKRGKRHDYFTSCLPFAQKGSPVGISLAGNLPIKNPVGFGTYTSNSIANITSGAGGQVYNAGSTPAVSGLFADAAAATAITINAFRSAFLAQELLEIDARGGTRYPEMIYAHFGVSNPDARMQYPEYLGGDVTQLDITSVPQTAPAAGGSTPLGNLAAFGTFAAHRNGFIKSFSEHSVVIGLLCVYADLTYSQGLPRHFSYRTRLDYYLPVLANLGEQAVLNQEIYCQGTAGGTSDGLTLGFQERWAELRYMPNRVGGLFRPGVATNLAAWNLSQLFGSQPLLNAAFVVESPPFNRVVVVTTEPDFKADCYIDMTHVRPMPVRSIPVKLGGSGTRMF